MGTMRDGSCFIIGDAAERLPLLTEAGRKFLGLRNSSSPEICARVKSLFERLHARMGFQRSPSGTQAQMFFNLLLRYAYPEIMLDLADCIYTRHERPMVFLNWEHINVNLRHDPDGCGVLFSLERLHYEFETVFQQLTEMLSRHPQLTDDMEVVRPLAESYSYYVFQTGNFPWEGTLAMSAPPPGPLLDVASGLAGFSLLHAWPENYPPLLLADRSPFIRESLAHFKGLLNKKNVKIVAADFAAAQPLATPCGEIRVSKFLHHLRREDRRRFLRWAGEQLLPGGRVRIIDTDLENQILRRAGQPDFRLRLIRGYVETLVEVESEFPGNLPDDLREAGLQPVACGSNEYHDETDAYSLLPGDNIELHFTGVEITAEQHKAS